MRAKTKATIHDLYRVPEHGKTEIVHGELVLMAPTGGVPGRAMAEKRADYFAAGTLVVWDVDVLQDQVIRVYRHPDPLRPRVYGRGEIAEAEPAVPGWTLPVDDLFI